MIVKVFFDGIKSHLSSKGNQYADVYVRGMSDDGLADFEQLKLRTFNEDVIKACQRCNKDDVLDLELTIRDATVEGVM